jgi:hypothetical protein
MESEADDPAPARAIRCAGDRVEVVDPTNRAYGSFGIVKFFVGDNVYITLAGKRKTSTTMFFLSQLRAAEPLPSAPAPALTVVPAGADEPPARRPFADARRPRARTRPST